MRRLVTFVVRLWVDAQAEPPSWEGQVECIADGEHAHIGTAEELLGFIHTHTATEAAADCLLWTPKDP
ncbi:MAG TPA: hypothetical protein PLH19_12450 [Anaerolineae bacterium]|nr:hypothetical protein [Anaerolineae bacterium]HQH39328.1 hypothetical protein [Anaerolineae bacterium]